MIIYDQNSMVSPVHIKVINEQLKKFGSQVPLEILNDGQEHALFNILRLSCSKGTFGHLALEDINSIRNQEFKLSYIP